MKRCVLLPLLLAGCSAPAPTTVDTGAKDAAKRFYQAVVSKDWAAAHQLLAADSARKLSREQFAALAASHRKAFGFEPQSVVVHAIDEHGSEAVAHVILSGTGHARHRFKDAITLRSENQSWRVVLPASFGRVAKS